MDKAQLDACYTASFGRLVDQVPVLIGSRDEAPERAQAALVRAWSRLAEGSLRV